MIILWNSIFIPFPILKRRLNSGGERESCCTAPFIIRSFGITSRQGLEGYTQASHEATNSTRNCRRKAKNLHRPKRVATLYPLWSFGLSLYVLMFVVSSITSITTERREQVHNRFPVQCTAANWIFFYISWHSQM